MKVNRGTDKAVSKDYRGLKADDLQRLGYLFASKVHPGTIPVNRLQTEKGAQEVEDLLGCIKNGIIY